MPLSRAEAGRDVVVMDVLAGRGLRQRLMDMGLVPGAVVRVMSNSSAGPLIVAVKETRLTLGRGMAHKIMVS